MFKQSVIAGFVLAVVFASPAIGQPPRSIQHLMNQPLSIFDFGLYRLHEDLDDWVSYQRFNLPSRSRFKYQVYYHEASRSIRLDFVVNLPVSYNTEITTREKACERVVTALRRYFFTIGKSRGEAPISEEARRDKGIYRYFSYRGTNETGRPDNAMQEIEAATVLRVMLVPGKKLDQAFKCLAPLMGEDLEFPKFSGPFSD